MSRPTAAWYGCDGPETPRSIISMRRRDTTTGASGSPVTATAAAHPECARKPMATGEDILPENDLRNHQLRQGLVPATRNIVERQPEVLDLARRQAAGLLAYDGHPLAQHQLAIGVVEHAVDLHHPQRAAAVVANLASDLDHRLLHIAFVLLHIDVHQLQVVHVGFRFGCERRGGWRRAVRRPIEEEKETRAQDDHESHHKHRNGSALLLSCCFAGHRDDITTWRPLTLSAALPRGFRCLQA